MDEFDEALSDDAYTNHRWPKNETLIMRDIWHAGARWQFQQTRVETTEFLDVIAERKHQISKLYAEIDELKAELAVARERLGPAGYKIISDVAGLKAEVERLKSKYEPAN